MSLQSDPATTRVTVILDKQSDWHSWLFVRKDSAIALDVWKYMDPSVKKEDVPAEPTEPTPPALASYKQGATSLAHLEKDDRDTYRWEYEEYKEKLAKYEKHKKSLTTMNSEIGKTVAKRHLFLLKDETTPYDRMTKLKLHFAPTDSTRKREVAAKYTDLKTPPKGKKVEEWLRQWVEVTNQCKDLDLPEIFEQRAQEDSLIAAKQIDPKFAAAALRDLYRLEVQGKSDNIPTLEEYVTEFTNYLRKSRPTSIGLSANAAELNAQKPQNDGDRHSPNNGDKKERCPCGSPHHTIPNCWYLNENHPKRPKNFQARKNTLDRVKKAKKDPTTKAKIDKALQEWSQNQEDNSPTRLDDGKPPSDELNSNTAALCIPEEAVPSTIENEATTDIDDTGVVDDAEAPSGELTVMCSGTEMRDRMIVDPGANTHIINSEHWIGWTREYEETSGRTIGAGQGHVPIEAWGTLKIMTRTPSGLRPLEITRGICAWIPHKLTGAIKMPINTHPFRLRQRSVVLSSARQRNRTFGLLERTLVYRCRCHTSSEIGTISIICNQIPTLRTTETNKSVGSDSPRNMGPPRSRCNRKVT